MKKQATTTMTKGEEGSTRAGWFDILAVLSEKYVPDAITTSIILMVFLVMLSLTLDNAVKPLTLNGAATGQAVGVTPPAGVIPDRNVLTLQELQRLGVVGTEQQVTPGDMDALRLKASVSRLFDAYYRGLWMLLPFTMQMTLILVLSLVLAATPAFKTAIVAISRIPRNTTEVVITAVLFTGFISYLNWGLSITLSPVIAVYMCKEAERRGIRVDFLYMLAIMAGAGSVWQFGLSASGPLLMASNNHFLVKEGIEVWPLASTIFTPAALTMVFAFTVATILAGCLFMPRNVRPISAFPESDRLGERTPSDQTVGDIKEYSEYPIAQKMERSTWTLVPMYIALLAWLYFHFFVSKLALEINSLITIYLLACFLLHRTVLRFTTALQEAIVASWPIVIMYHLYAGVAGLIQYTSVGEYISSLVVPISTAYTFPFLTAAISSVVAVFLPSSGTQWAIQGLITVKTAVATGLSGQHGLLALSVGDQMGNLIAPFWAVVSAGIARVDFRQFFGYRLIFAVIWFVMGVIVFTFIPT